MKQHQRVAATSKCSIFWYKNNRNANYLNFDTKLEMRGLTSNNVSSLEMNLLEGGSGSARVSVKHVTTRIHACKYDAYLL